MLDINHRTVVITGGATGIGFGLGEGLWSAGCAHRDWGAAAGAVG